MIRKIAKQTIRYFSSNKFTTLNRIEISKTALLYNFSFFQKNNPNFSIIPVLKSNAYGHGIVQCAQVLNEANCDFLAVDGYFEANKILEITKHKILVLGFINSENFKLLDFKKCSFVIQDVDSLHELGKLNKKVNIHVELNTGMNRLGLSEADLGDYLAILRRYPKLNLDGIMTHLADADNDKIDDFTERQVELFDLMVDKIIKSGFSPKFIHVAQTAGCLVAKSKHANAVRIGIGMYGINPFGNYNEKSHLLDDLRPVMKIKSTIIKVIDLKPGDKVSYSGTFVANKTMRIGVLPIGYYEGVPRELSNCGFATFNDLNLPILGRVCMNHTMIGLVDSNLKVGDEVVIIDSNKTQINSIEQICKAEGLFSYQLMSNITENIRRVVVD